MTVIQNWICAIQLQLVRALCCASHIIQSYLSDKQLMAKIINLQIMCGNFRRVFCTLLFNGWVSIAAITPDCKSGTSETS